MRDLEQVIMRGYESKTLDYKGPCKWDENDKEACCKLVKDILAMSNTGGGYLVVGVAETKGMFDYVGLSDDQLHSFETSRINRFLQNYSDPPINCIVVKVPIYEQTYVVIGVPGFMETPHLCQKEFPNVLLSCGLYVRTDNNESALVKSSADFRKIIERAVRNKEDALLESFRAILSNSREKLEEQNRNEQYIAELEDATKRGTSATFYKKSISGESKYSGYREFWSYPLKYLPDRFDLSQLHSASRQADVEFRGWPFLFYGNQKNDQPYAIEGGIEAKTRFVDFAAQDRADYWQFRVSGLFYQRVLMWEESYSGRIHDQPLMHFIETALYASEGLYTIMKLYGDILDVHEELKVGIRLEGTQGRTLFTDTGVLRTPYIAMVPSMTFEKVRTLADWRAGIVDHALEITGFFLERFNWLSPNLGACKSARDKMFSRRL